MENLNTQDAPADTAPVREHDGSMEAAASLMSDMDVGGFDAPQVARAENGKFAKADASGEAVQEEPAEVKHGDNDKPIKADADAVEPEATNAENDDDDDYVEIPATEDGAEPARYKLTELVEAHAQLTATKQELERAKQVQPLPSDFEIALQETVAERDRYARSVEEWARFNPVGNPPHKEFLNENSPHYDPAAYYAQLNAYEQRVQQHQEARAEYEALMKRNQEDREKVFNSQLLRARDKVVEFWPELKDPAVNQRVRQELETHYGITSERLSTITDPDAFRIMKDALAFKRGEANKPKALKAVTAKPKLVPAKARQASSTAKAQKSAEARRRFTSSHSVEDAADVLGDFI